MPHSRHAELVRAGALREGEMANCLRASVKGSGAIECDRTETWSSAVQEIIEIPFAPAADGTLLCNLVFVVSEGANETRCRNKLRGL